MAIFRVNQHGVSTIEACIALPVVFLSLFGAFAIAESFFVASKMVHLSTGAAISLRAVAQAGQKITPAPPFANLVYSTDPSKAAAQLNWYNQNATQTGYTSTSQVHRMFLNLFLGTLVQIYPEASSPPTLTNGQVELKRAVEARLTASGEDTLLQLRTAPVLGNLLKKIFLLGNSELVFSATTTIAGMSIAAAVDDNVDDTYEGSSSGGFDGVGMTASPVLHGITMKDGANFKNLVPDGGVLTTVGGGGGKGTFSSFTPG